MSQVESSKPTEERLPHSRWGSLSFALAILSIGAFCVFFAAHAYLIITVPGFHPPQNLPPEELSTYPTFRLGMLFGSLYVGCMLVSLVAFYFGIVGVGQPHTRKVFAIYGLLLSALPGVLLLVVIILGFTIIIPELIVSLFG